MLPKHARTRTDGEAAPLPPLAGPGLPLDLVLLACSFLTPNDIACTARLLCKAVAQHFSAPHHHIVCLSQPVPPHAFAARLGRGADPQPLKQLSLQAKERLFLLTASTGSLDNVAALVERMEPPFWWRWKVPEVPPQLRSDACAAAARNGHMHVVRWLLQSDYPLDAEAAMAAVLRHCDLADAQWLLAQDRVRSHRYFASGGLPSSAARAIGGSTTGDAPEKLDWLKAQWKRVMPALWRAVAEGAAEVDNLPALEWAMRHCTARAAAAFEEHALQKATAFGAAKLTVWLLGRGAIAGSSVEAAGRAAEGGHTAVLWLLLPRALEGAGGDEDERVKLVRRCLGSAACSGCAGALRCVCELAASHGVEVSDEELYEAEWRAARSGSVEAARWLRQQRGLAPMSQGTREEAATAGCIPTLRFNGGEAAAAAAQRNAEAMLLAALRGRVPGGVIPVLQRLHELGCTLEVGNARSSSAPDRRMDTPVRVPVLEAATRSGCVAAVEGLASLRCPMGRSGHPYTLAGRNGDLDMLRCLRRLGVPWSRGTVLGAVAEGMPTHVVAWMVGEGRAPCNERAVAAAPAGSELARVLRSAVSKGAAKRSTGTKRKGRRGS